LGSGSYGIVSAYKDTDRNKEVAIKRVKRVCDDFLVLRRTLRELKLMKHFHHPNILKLVDVLQINDCGDLYMVLELMDLDLDKVIHSRKYTLNEYQIRCFTFQMLLGLLHLHSGHVIHRDLKPSNVFIRHSGELKLGDLGLARVISVDEEGEATHPEDEMLTEYVVTRWYRAPEVLLARSKYGPPVDIWSVGCILYEM
jgi:serine/threonine protein kinase